VGAASAGGLDLPPELQRELRELAAREGSISHYELLGVPADADGAAIRRAFLEKSRRFHPDAWYRKELGEFAPLLTRAFQRINAAYQLLSDQESRARYDQEHRELFSEQDKQRVDQRTLSVADEERRARERRERMLRTKGFARVGAARQLFQQAEAHAAEGNRTAAIVELRAARELDPQRKEIAQRLADLEKEAARARVAQALVSARDWEAQGQLSKAVGIYGSAFQQDPTSAEAALGAARCAAAQSDWQTAASWAQRAVDAAPAVPLHRLELARAFGHLKMKARAKAELQVVLKAHPDHPEAKALLKGL
jgi:curved DNA-binding protein CbpA